MKNALVAIMLAMAFAPWAFVLFAVPGAWFFFDVWLMPRNMNDPITVFGWGPLCALWTAVWFSAASAI